jgi:hypothetical protein
MCPLGKDGMSADPDVRACDATFESKQSECQAAHPARNSINSGRPRGKLANAVVGVSSGRAPRGSFRTLDEGPLFSPMHGTDFERV